VPTRSAWHLAEAGLFLYVTAWFGYLHLRRAATRENGLFALVALGAAGTAAGTAIVVRSHSLAEAAFGQRLMHVSVLFATAALVAFVDALTAARGRSGTWLARAAVVAACLAWAGAFFDPGTFAPSYDGSWSATPTARLTPIGIVGLGVGVVSFVWTTARLGDAARRTRGLRGAFLAMTLPLAAGTFDVVSRVVGGPTLHLASLGSLFLIIALSYVLLQRLVEVDATLERKSLELGRAHADLRAAENTLVRKEQLAAVGELAAVIAHEIRNPLTILKNAASGLSRESVGEADRETLLTILDQEADRLNHLVSDLIAYASPLVPDTSPVDVVMLVRSAAQLAIESHPEREDIRAVVRGQPQPTTAWADPALLRHAVINIVDNAILAMPSGGDVTIDIQEVARPHGPCVAIAFTDEGEGMNTLVRQRARDVFFTTRSGGTGLGLAIVDRVARAHRGSVEIESREGQGTTVTLYVPVDRASAPPPPS
jgi:signal transduction histidine kinase